MNRMLLQVLLLASAACSADAQVVAGDSGSPGADASPPMQDAKNTTDSCDAGGCAPGAHGMFVLFPPAPSDPTFINHVKPALLDSGGPGTPYVKGATIAVPWKTIQAANGALMFDAIDALVKPWVDAGKQFALVFQPTSVTETHADVNTPTWYVTPSNIASITQSGTTITITLDGSTPATNWAVGALKGQVVQIAGTSTAMDGMFTVASNPDPTHIVAMAKSSATLSATTGTAGNPVFGATGNCKNGAVPVAWTPNFIGAWKGVMTAARAHWASSQNLAYMRFGLGIGGEIFISSSFDNSACRAELVADGYTDSAWTSYLMGMADFIHASAFPWTVDVALDQNSFQHSTCTTKDCGGYSSTADVVADYFASQGIALGTEGIQNDDIANYGASQPCFVGNWCRHFDAHPEVPKQIQGRTAPSDPTNLSTAVLDQTGVTGSWTQLLPFGLARGAQIVEVFFTDWLCAFDSTWTMAPGDAGATDTYGACNQAGYPGAFAKAAGHIN